MNVILYCRVSSDEQSENTSLDFQEKVLRAYCSSKQYEVIMCGKSSVSCPLKPSDSAPP